MVTKGDVYPLLRADDLRDQLRDINLISMLDLSKAYNQIANDEKALEWVNCRSHRGIHQCLVMQFGLKNAPAAFQKFMDHILSNMIGVNVIVYIDDILVYTKKG